MEKDKIVNSMGKKLYKKFFETLKEKWVIYFLAIIIIGIFVIGIYSFGVKPLIYDIIDFENPHLEKAVEESLNYLNISKQEAEDIKKLSIKSRNGFSNLNDLKWFPNLEELEITGCSLRSLDGIENLKKLKVLNCSDNNISDISALYDNDLKLQSIDLSKNNVSDIYRIASYLPGLEILNVAECKLTGEIDFGENTNLKSINISSNYVSKISGVLPNLEIISCTNNDIEDISQFLTFSKLKELRLSNNEMLKSIEGLSTLENLELISIEKTGIENIDELKNVKKLNSIYIDGAIDRNQIDFIIDNFKTGDTATKQYVLKNKYEFLE